MVYNQLSEYKLDRYRDFVETNSKYGVYNPESGLEGLLSILTPDTKGVVLHAMENGDIYFSDWYLNKAVLNWLEGIGLDRRLFPLTRRAPWKYCKYKENNIVFDGSLVEAGAVIEEYLETPEGLKVGYHISTAGAELGIPLVLAAMEFVCRARNTDIKHRYDSMWRIFSNVSSRTENRRQLAVYKVVKYLIDNPGYHRWKDLIEALKDIHSTVISSVLNSLGHAGIIDYESPHRDVAGRRASGWVTYSSTGKMMTLDEISGEIKRRKKYFRDIGYLSKIIKFIQENPGLIYEANALSGKFEISSESVSSILSTLADIEILKRERGLKGGETQSRARAHKLTRMLYEIVLAPAWYSASTVTPIERRATDPENVRVFLENFQEERSNIGPQGGIEIRNILLNILSVGEEMKLSHIVEEGNKQLGRKLKINSFRYPLNILTNQRLIKKSRKGCYSIM